MNLNNNVDFYHYFDNDDILKLILKNDESIQISRFRGPTLVPDLI